MNKKLIALCGLTLLRVSLACATPSTQVWIPSTDIQPFGVPHFGLDGYFRTSGHQYLSSTDPDPTVYDAGLTIGVLPLDVVQMEVGADYIGNGTKYDFYPVYFNAKIGTPEGALFTNSPALAIGGYGFGTNWRPSSPYRTDQNVVYGLAAKTLPACCGLPSLGRLSAGWYVGNDEVLLGPGGSKDDNQGVLLSLDRTMSEISDKLWAAVDYQGGDNALGALSFGVGWSFTSKISMIVGYDLYNKKSVAGGNTATVQLDVNF